MNVQSSCSISSSRLHPIAAGVSPVLKYGSHMTAALLTGESPERINSNTNKRNTNNQTKGIEQT